MQLTEQIYLNKQNFNQINIYVAAFDYIDQALIVLSATSGGVSIISFTSIVRAPVRIASASLTLFFFYSNNRNSQKINEYNKKQKEKA